MVLQQKNDQNLYQKIFASHFGQLAIIFLWSATRSPESTFVTAYGKGGQ